MRTQQRDQDGMTTFAANVADAAAGSGIAQPGNIPFTFTRIAAGQYDYRFDTALIPVGVNITADGSATNQAMSLAIAPGTFRAITAAGGAATSARHQWTVTALDKRQTR